MLKLTKNFPQKRAFITGAGSGLGFALAMHLAKDGWTIGISDLKQETVDETIQKLEAAGGKALGYAFDVSKRDDFAAAAQEFTDSQGGIDVVVNNAGVSDGGAFHNHDLERWDWMIGINQMGVIYGCHYFLPEMRKAKSGHIINISSAAGFAYGPAISAYNVTKAAVNALSECLYFENQPVNVKVSVVMPTFFKTNIATSWRGSEKGKAAAQKLVDRSGLTAEEVSLEILERAGAGEFRIVLPSSARWLYRLIRFFPRLYRRRVLNSTRGSAK